MLLSIQKNGYLKTLMRKPGIPLRQRAGAAAESARRRACQQVTTSECAPKEGVPAQGPVIGPK